MNDNLILFTIVTKEGPGFKALESSALSHGFKDPVILTDPECTSWNNPRRWGRKLILTKQYLDTLPDSQIVMFCDAFDTLIIDSPKNILKKYQDFNHKFVVSAERNLWPTDTPIMRTYFPEQTTPYRFLNNGCWIGEAGYVRKVFDQMHVKYLAEWESDQEVMQSWYIIRPDAIRLDVEARLFLNTFGTDIDKDIDYLSGLVYDRASGAYPSVLHFNGSEGKGPIVRNRVRPNQNNCPEEIVIHKKTSNIALVSVGWRRPYLQSKSLDSIARADGIDTIDVFVVNDGGGISQDTLSNMVAHASLPNPLFRICGIDTRSENVGCCQNIHRAIRDIFNRGYEYCIVVEDDNIVARDFIRFHTHARGIASTKTLSICGYQAKLIEPVTGVPDASVCKETPWFCPDGVGYERHQYLTHIDPAMDAFYQDPKGSLEKLRASILLHEPNFYQEAFGGDEHFEKPLHDAFQNAIRASKGMVSIVPKISRVQDLGIYGLNQIHHYMGDNPPSQDELEQGTWWTRYFQPDSKWDNLILFGTMHEKNTLL